MNVQRNRRKEELERKEQEEGGIGERDAEMGGMLR